MMRSLRNMLDVDFKRMTSEKLLYIGSLIALLMPILILVMTTSVGSSSDMTFTNAWQAIGSLGSSSAMSMDMTSMCNINLIYVLNVVLVCLFIGEEFKSGYVKNILTNHANRLGYVLSKIIVGSLMGIIFILLYFIGTVIGGKIANLSFGLDGISAFNIVCCILAKSFFMIFMVGIATLASTFGKTRIWLSILLSLAGTMLLFTMIPMITPLSSTLLNVFMCLAGGIIFGVAFAFGSNLILDKIDII